MWRPRFAWALLLALAGCGQGEPTMHHSWGTITFDGKPVPAGRVDFFPDKGNEGPQGFALIKAGKYDTRQGGQGHAGGAMVIRIAGFDGQSDNPDFAGNPIFNVYEIRRELPRSAGEQSFEVPAAAAEGLIVPRGPKS